jgi:hypothetical protein
MRLFAQKHDLMKSAHTAPVYLRQPVDPVAEMMQAEFLTGIRNGVS